MERVYAAQAGTSFPLVDITHFFHQKLPLSLIIGAPNDGAVPSGRVTLVHHAIWNVLPAKNNKH